MSQYEPMYDSFRRTPSERHVPTARMSVSASVYLPGSEVDMYTGQLKPDHQRRRRTQAKRLEKERLEREEKRQKEAYEKEMNKGGVRVSINAGIVFLVAVFCLCGMTLLYQHGRIQACQKEINRLERSIAECRKENEKLADEVAAASDPAVICYAASQRLNMIPSEAAHAIHLTAVDTRPLQTAQKAQQVVIASEVQNTPVPMIASN